MLSEEKWSHVARLLCFSSLAYLLALKHPGYLQMAQLHVHTQWWHVCVSFTNSMLYQIWLMPLWGSLGISCSRIAFPRLLGTPWGSLLVALTLALLLESNGWSQQTCSFKWGTIHLFLVCQEHFSLYVQFMVLCSDLVLRIVCTGNRFSWAVLAKL